MECPPLSNPVYVDIDMWQNIEFNLLSNALKFTREGAITVRLSEDDGGIALFVQVNITLEYYEEFCVHSILL